VARIQECFGAPTLLLLALSIVGCSSAPGYREVTIRARDYAFEVPDSLRAGPVASPASPGKIWVR
jgi:hypothetical protein